MSGEELRVEACRVLDERSCGRRGSDEALWVMAAADETCIDVNVAISEHYDDVTQYQSECVVEVRIVFGLLYSAVWVAGVAFNSGVILLVGRRKTLRSASNTFLLNLVASDLLLCVTAVPVTPFAVIRKEWIFGSFLCRTIPLSQSWSVLITSWSLTAIALDKFIHIQDSTKAPITQAGALAITAGIWVVSGLINVPYMLSYKLIDGRDYSSNASATPYCGAFCEELNWAGETHRRAYGTSIMALQFVIPMVIITMAYSRILAIVRRDMIVGDSAFSSSLSRDQRKDALRRKRKVNYILIGMVAAFISAWFPLTLVNILRDFNALPAFVSTQPWLWTLVVHIVAMTTVLWNPILFFWLTRKGRSSGKLKRLGKEMRDQLSSTGPTYSMPATRVSRVPPPSANGKEEEPLVPNGHRSSNDLPRPPRLPPLIYLRLGDSARC